MWLFLPSAVPALKKTCRQRMRLILVLLLMFIAQVTRAENSSYWQLTLAYTSDTLVVQEAAKIPPLGKKIETPGILGALIKIPYQLDWLDGSGQVLTTTDTELPLGLRGLLTPQGATRPYLPTAGVLVVRLKGPADEKVPCSVRLRLKPNLRLQSLSVAPIPGIFARDQMTLSIQSLRRPGDLRPMVAGPIQAVKIHDTGPDAKRLVLVLCGDGYTATDLQAGQFTLKGNLFLQNFQNQSPWDMLFPNVNVYRIDVESNQEGADRSQTQTSPMVDTYFNATYWTSGMDRLLTIDSVGQQRAVQAANQLIGAGVWDYIMINVNSTVYGGSGGWITVYSNHSSSTELVNHEFGHSFAGLADEYSSPYPGYPAGDGEPNVDYDFSGSGLKWLAWVTEGIPLPTPALTAYQDAIGAFEGARYLETGIYRPTLHCKMRDMGVDFCPVCKEAHLLSFFDRIDIIDQATPPAKESVVVPETGASFSLVPIDLRGLTYEWLVDGVARPSAKASSFTLFPADLGDHRPHTLKVLVRYPTTMVRLRPILSGCSWDVTLSETKSRASRAWLHYH